MVVRFPKIKMFQDSFDDMRKFNKLGEKRNSRNSGNHFYNILFVSPMGNSRFCGRLICLNFIIIFYGIIIVSSG